MVVSGLPHRPAKFPLPTKAGVCNQPEISCYMWPEKPWKQPAAARTAVSLHDPDREPSAKIGALDDLFSAIRQEKGWNKTQERQRER